MGVFLFRYRGVSFWLSFETTTKEDPKKTTDPYGTSLSCRPLSTSVRYLDSRSESMRELNRVFRGISMPPAYTRLRYSTMDDVLRVSTASSLSPSDPYMASAMIGKLRCASSGVSGSALVAKLASSIRQAP